MTRVAILGAGPAGLGAALALARSGHAATVFEQTDRVGGNAGSFELAGMPVDYGSHRFHAAADPAVLGLIRELLGDDLLLRPRHGRIRLLGRWIHFPLRSLDLVLRMHPKFAVGVAADLVGKVVSRKAPSPAAEDTFASVLERGLGSTICGEFYFPYARKIWGLEPDDISPIQAYKRVSAGSIGKLLKRLIPGGSAGARGRRGFFYYPRDGFGAISERLREAAEAAGARILLRNSVETVNLCNKSGLRVEGRSAEGQTALTCDHVWSTIPVGVLVRVVRPDAPTEVTAAASRLKLRAMLLVYLVLETDRFTEYDAHYFPEEAVPFTRLSEPKNYAARSEPKGRTVLCAEIPCSAADEPWSRTDDELGAIVCEGLARVGLPVRVPLIQVAVRRLPAAYPIYKRGYEADFNRVDEWISGLHGVLSFGRQGLYAHDNTHHALFMAHAAVDSLRDGQLDPERWAQYRRAFDRHVVED